mmetsp:Transcript_14929/g.20235  ORF Transcript_14929/g.20235 Transcript_14929/m.20235 type:complete len:193 (+) Transcript_14929:47-625(+)|eukprot:CAMPEP_0185569462 /NCGR_PEP_ID=MMETSP0434-20130131/2072_1 /TAXON_ID=626734 ORGANISM="Favella taraikaensis, Strain Fe Narragansett Bay" /NCGR_SAMPLE_ID=MMETSP0434 /ASSEMBLY_ACC=CAM_ASM_000379 /LENGTH=192 /DNA_ID=CAMNT_0028184247 /DNA_START=21 /DNA_END=599 /DNA_ORIENTATION=+
MSQLTFSTLEGTEYKLAADLFAKSGLVATLLADEDDTTEIPLPGVHDREFQKVVMFLKQQAEEPITRIERPLPSADLKEAGVPAWADDFAKSVEMENIVDLVEAADHLQLHMLKALLCARIAAEIKEVGIEKFLAHYKITEELPEQAEANLKNKNDWAWKNPDAPVTDDATAEGGEGEAEGKAEEAEAKAEE